MANENKGITQANVTNAAQGVYCIDGLNPAPIAVQATLRYVSNPNHGTVYAEIAPSGGSPCTGSQVGILTFSNNNDDAAASKPFNLVLFSP